MEEYWRLWNMPVHQWLMRHIYFPLLKRNFRKDFAYILVFAVSAICHEYIISASVGVIEYWAFGAMIL
jgi:diacylglycerol O-acyltransferase-1